MIQDETKYWERQFSYLTISRYLGFVLIQIDGFKTLRPCGVLANSLLIYDL